MAACFPESGVGKPPITAILLNWKRKENIERILTAIKTYPLIDEIIVWNNNPEMHFTPDKGVFAINCSNDFGLFTRFAAAGLAKNRCIMFHDDDVLVPETTVRQLHERWCENPKICHGLFGRQPVQDRYTYGDVFGNIDIVLTRCMLVSKEICLLAYQATPEFASLPGKPVGNGEDIILSYAAMSRSGRKNRAYQLEVLELGEDAHSICLRWEDHKLHRTRLLHRAWDVFHIGRKMRRPKVLLRTLWHGFKKTRGHTP